jgi:hypothetical protein
MQKPARRISDAAITGSFKIWRKCEQKMKRGSTAERDEEGVIEQ